MLQRELAASNATVSKLHEELSLVREQVRSDSINLCCLAHQSLNPGCH